MIEHIEKKILTIREQPESVRMRYLLLCLTVTMFFIVSIWIFSLKESARDISRTNIKSSLPELKVEDKIHSLESLGKDKPLGSTPTPSTRETEPFEKLQQ